MDWADVCDAYLLGRSYVGMRAEDVLVASRYAFEHLGGSPAVAAAVNALAMLGQEE